ncbi:MAG: hypothetical protein ACYDHW_15475 [Syntrophorhabdaceae bacterium]
MTKYPTGIAFIVAAAIIIILVIPYVHPACAAESGCVNCHTNEKILKALHAPVKVELSEGVG